MKNKTLHILFLSSYIAVLIWSVIHPRNLLTWFLELVPGILGVLLLIFTYPRFKFTNLTYVLLWISAIFIAIGGHYTYANMPLFDWLRDTFHFQRNHYDRFVHFTEGVTAAVLLRELLLRKSPLKRGKLLLFIVAGISLSFSAFYELTEFAVAKIAGKSAEAFLGLQGDVWDTQWDMLMGLTGAVLALLALGGVQDQLLTRKQNEGQKSGHFRLS
ncbi:DUF2238 domain-containing protein [Effusibacillus consociatus]|uniref:DUF2238 domain-containing protein n=1 Tax=Effusibacillus consociatus TaxID=1117041 RepID=A0ABV9PYD6_9BACL